MNLEKENQKKKNFNSNPVKAAAAHGTRTHDYYLEDYKTMKYNVAIKISTVIYRTVEADSEDEIYDAVDEARTYWDLDDVLVDMDEVERIFVYDENGNMREIEF